MSQIWIRAFALGLTLPAAVVALGCETKADYDFETPSGGHDEDGDGVTDFHGDCDDTNPDVSPEAEEVCDGMDNNCDGLVDEGAVDAITWYIDYDLDGYGASSAYDAVSCSRPEAYVADNTDCDDQDAAVNPEAAEICDGLDNNCNGEADEDASADDATWYLDGDGDGYGSTEDTLIQCSQPKGYVLEGGDCDDADSADFPEAAELCDEDDDDCDGQIDEDITQRWYQDDDGDGYGLEDESQEVDGCDGVEGYTNVSDDFDCDDDDEWSYPGAPELCDGVDNDCDGGAGDEGLATWFGEDETEDWTEALTVEEGGDPAALTLEDDGELRFCDGTWFVNLEIDGATVAVSSLNGASETILSGGGEGSVLKVLAGGYLDLSGVNLTEGSANQGGGLYLSYATARLSEAAITYNEASDDGGGLYVSASSVELYNTRIEGNTAGDDGGGVYIYGGSEVGLAGATVTGNSASADGGGIYAYAFSILSLESSGITDNLSGEDGAGLVVGYSSSAELSLSSVTGNIATDNGGGIYLFGYSQLTAAGSEINTNGAGSTGGGIILVDAEAELGSSSLVGNSAAQAGGGAYVDEGGALSVSDGYVAKNTPDAVQLAGGLTYDYSDTVSFSCDESACE